MIETLKVTLLKGDKTAFKQEVVNQTGLHGAACLNDIDGEGNSLLHLAVMKGALPFVKCLLAENADITLQNHQGNTPLHLAVQQGYFNIVYEMLGISAAAKDRKNKIKWQDKDRGNKASVLKESQKRALSLLHVENNQGETPLVMAAKLQDDLVYKKLLLLEPAPGYKKEHLDSVSRIRQKHVGRLKSKSFTAALIETFCPSASIAELTESFAYSGLLVGASAAVALGVNIGFAVIAILGFSIIMYANYKKMQSEKNAVWELEELQAELALLLNIRKRVQQLSSQPSLTVQERKELEFIREELKKTINKPESLQGNERNAADFITGKDKIYVALSSTGSFLCAYSGALGVAGLGLAVAAQIMGTSLAGLIVLAGPVGICVALGGGLLLAAALAFYHYKTRKQDYMVFGEQRQAIYKLQDSIYRKQQDIIHGPDNVLNSINSLLDNNLSEQPEEKRASAIIEPARDKYDHGHGPDEICSIESGQLQSIGLLRRTRSLSEINSSVPDARWSGLLQKSGSP
ncbi:ankyrin repeat domain-containing protein [Legionella spiritensis]|uniref:Ankyrin repeat protein n=1 Tax=Legionella spiritensis TaxID=452 RepID=A0A0W0YYM0_LEGSP|nr:ankyrin repeat domain-containing protein [Legionella spiritensis]KTD61683.1 Ankyrin repeat protein [Legionella spiritensis]SNV38959.1 Ankyrin repeat protein [Legionella spiritensis]